MLSVICYQSHRLRRDNNSYPVTLCNIIPVVFAGVPENALAPTFFFVSFVVLIVIFFRLLHPWNAFLPIDATFMPIKRVSYNVESTRVGDSIDFDKLTLEIWSNGSVEVTNALSQASNLLIEHFMQIASITGQPVVTSAISYDEDFVEESETPTMTIEELELSVRAYNCLKRASINSMSELLKKSEHDLLNIKNFGKKSSDEVIERLHHFGLDLAPNPDIEEEII